MLKYRQIKAGLVLEVMIDHPDVRARGIANCFEAAAGEAFVGELVDSSLKNAVTCGQIVAASDRRSSRRLYLG
jgi:hypothetical protein